MESKIASLLKTKSKDRKEELKKIAVPIPKIIATSATVYAGILATMHISAYALNQFTNLQKYIGLYVPKTALAIYFAPTYLRGIKSLEDNLTIVKKHTRNKEQKKLEKFLKPFIDKAFDSGSYAIKKDDFWLVRRHVGAKVEKMTTIQFVDFRSEIEEQNGELLTLKFNLDRHEGKTVTNAILTRHIGYLSEGLTEDKPGVIEVKNGVVTKKYYKAGRDIGHLIDMKIESASDLIEFPIERMKIIEEDRKDEILAILVENFYIVKTETGYNQFMSCDEIVDLRINLNKPLNIIRNKTIYNWSAGKKFLKKDKASSISRFVKGRLEGDTADCPSQIIYHLTETPYFEEKFHHEGKNLEDSQTIKLY